MPFFSAKIPSQTTRTKNTVAETEDLRAAHISSFEIKDAQVTGVEQRGKVLVRHDLHLRVTEGRFEHLAGDDRGKPPPSNLRYGCRIDVVGARAPDYVSLRWLLDMLIG